VTVDYVRIRQRLDTFRPVVKEIEERFKLWLGRNDGRNPIDIRTMPGVPEPFDIGVDEVRALLGAVKELERELISCEMVEKQRGVYIDHLKERLYDLGGPGAVA
jgi:hypothetical protein